MDEHLESGSTLEEPGELGSGQELASGTGLSSPSQGALRQPPSLQPSTLQSDLDGLEGQIEAAIERHMQSGKDRALRRLERELQEVKGELVELRKAKEEAMPALPARGQPVAKASHVIQPSGGGLPAAPDLRAEYERRVSGLRPGDVAGLMEVKREFRKRGLEVY